MTQEKPPDKLGVRSLTNTSMGLFQTGAITLEVFLHHSLGARAIKNRTGVAVVVMLVFTILFKMLFPDANPRPFLYFGGAFIVLALKAEMGAVIRRWRGRDNLHTFYSGTPYVMWLLPRWNEVAIKILEPFAVCGIGLVVHRFDLMLGTYLIVASFALFMSVLISIQDQRARRMDMNDAVIEQTINAERVRNMQQR